MANDDERRDQMWAATWETFYDSYFWENVYESLHYRWQLVDETTKIVVAATASGSAIAGWALWSAAQFKIIWVVLAAVAAVLGLIHSSLGVASRLADHGEVKRRLMSLRVELDTFMSRMKIKPDFSIDDFTNEFVEYRKRFGNDLQLRRSDVLLTNRFHTKTQDKLDQHLKQTKGVEPKRG